MKRSFDRIDLELLVHLQRDASVQNVELARAVGLSPAATLQRVRRLRRLGYIHVIRACLDARMVGLPIRAYVEVRLPQHEAGLDARFQRAVEAMPLVIAGDWVTGDWDAILTVVATNLEDLHATIAQLGRAGATRVLTHISVKQLKPDGLLPLDGMASPHPD